MLGASLATNSGEIDPGKLIVQNFGALALPVLFMVLHGPIATNILNIYSFSFSDHAGFGHSRVSGRKLNLFVGVLSFVAAVLIFQDDFASVLDSWLVGLVAGVAAWSGIMLVHFFWIEKRWPSDPARLFDAVGTKRLPGVNPAGIASLLLGIFATWLFMYGLVPAMQGPAAVALGGLGPVLARRRPDQRHRLRTDRPALPPQVPAGTRHRDHPRLRTGPHHRPPHHHRPRQPLTQGM